LIEASAWSSSEGVYSVRFPRGYTSGTMTVDGQVINSAGDFSSGLGTKAVEDALYPISTGRLGAAADLAELGDGASTTAADAASDTLTVYRVQGGVMPTAIQ